MAKAGPLAIAFFISVSISDLPSGSEIIHSVLILKIRALENTNEANQNGISGEQYIQVSCGSGSGINAIKLNHQQWLLEPATREFGDVIFGDLDISSEVNGNGTYLIKFKDATVMEDFLKLNDVLTGIKVYFKIRS